MRRCAFFLPSCRTRMSFLRILAPNSQSPPSSPGQAARSIAYPASDSSAFDINCSIHKYTPTPRQSALRRDCNFTKTVPFVKCISVPACPFLPRFFRHPIPFFSTEPGFALTLFSYSVQSTLRRPVTRFLEPYFFCPVFSSLCKEVWFSLVRANGGPSPAVRFLICSSRVANREEEE